MRTYPVHITNDHIESGLDETVLSNLSGLTIKVIRQDTIPYWEQVAEGNLRFDQHLLRSLALVQACKKNGHDPNHMRLRVKGRSFTPLEFFWKASGNYFPFTCPITPSRDQKDQYTLMGISQASTSFSEHFSHLLGVPRSTIIEQPHDHCLMIFEGLTHLAYINHKLWRSLSPGETIRIEEGSERFAHSVLKESNQGTLTRAAKLHYRYLDILYTESWDRLFAPKLEAYMEGTPIPERGQVVDAVHEIRLRLLHEITGISAELEGTHTSSDIYLSTSRWSRGVAGSSNGLLMSSGAFHDSLCQFALWGGHNFRGHPEIPLTFLRQLHDSQSIDDPFSARLAGRIIAAGDYFLGPQASRNKSVLNRRYDLNLRPR